MEGTSFDTEQEDRASAIKHKLGQVGRSLKKIDLHGTIVAHPFTAVGIAAAAGAIVGLVQPKPERGRISSALITTLGMIVFRLIRDTAVRELGAYARSYVQSHRSEGGDIDMPSREGSVRYTPSEY